MTQLPPSIILTIATLTAFFIFIVAAKFAVEDDFKRTRLIMSAFFLFIVATLTICFKDYFFATLPYTVPSGIVGVIAGFIIGLPAAESRMKKEGLSRYRHDFAEIEAKGVRGFAWWSVINFYTITGALLLINLVGFTTVILHNLMPMALFTSAVGAFLIGTLLPYLYHLWTIKTRS